MLYTGLERDRRAGALIVRLVHAALKAPPARRETLLRRAERLSAFRERFWRQYF